jgi:hypothetical protein
VAEPKGGLASVLGGGGSAEDDVADVDEYEAAKSDAAIAVMSALKASDAEAFKSALTDFVKLCASE